jgi:hypothetical protein
MGRSELDDVPHRTSQKFNHVNIHQHRLPGARLPRSLVMSKESYYVCTVTSTIPASAPVVIHVRIEVVESRIPQLRSVLLHVLRSTSKYSLPGAVAAAADNCAVYFRCTCVATPLPTAATERHHCARGDIVARDCGGIRKYAKIIVCCGKAEFGSCPGWHMARRTER